MPREQGRAERGGAPVDAGGEGEDFNGGAHEEGDVRVAAWCPRGEHDAHEHGCVEGDGALERAAATVDPTIVMAEKVDHEKDRRPGGERVVADRDGEGAKDRRQGAEGYHKEQCGAQVNDGLRRARLQRKALHHPGKKLQRRVADPWCACRSPRPIEPYQHHRAASTQGEHDIERQHVGEAQLMVVGQICAGEENSGAGQVLRHDDAVLGDLPGVISVEVCVCHQRLQEGSIDIVIFVGLLFP